MRIDDYIDPLLICNLSKIPWKMENNPFYSTTKLLLRGENEKHCFDHMVSIFKKSEARTKTMSSLYGYDYDNLGSLPGDTIFIPWLHTRPLSSDHRDVFFDCFSDKDYIVHQFSVIKDLAFSIRSRGYVPENYNHRNTHILGYWLELESKKKFYVSAGNHRAAVAAAVLDEKIPVLFEKKEHLKPRDLKNRKSFNHVFSDKEIKNWPSVKSGLITADVGLNILKSFF